VNTFAVSVIIPTYNRKSWLAQALNSVLRQTLPAAEIIVIDDGSTDGTGKWIGETFPGIIYHWQPQQGPAAARNRGAQLASADWLAFLDSDDRWLPQKLEKQRDFLSAHPDYECVYTDEIWIRSGRRVNQAKRHRKYGGRIYLHCLPLCVISPSSILMARRLWDALGGFDPNLPACEDYDLWLRLAARFPVGYLDEPLIIKYGGHADQLSRQWGLDRYRVMALQKMLRSGDLPARWFEATRQNLLQRCEILVAGFRKHGRKAEAARFEAIASNWKHAALPMPKTEDC